MDYSFDVNQMEQGITHATDRGYFDKTSAEWQCRCMLAIAERLESIATELDHLRADREFKETVDLYKG